MIKKKVLFSRIKIAIELSEEVKIEILERPKIAQMSFILKYINEIIGILEGKR